VSSAEDLSATPPHYTLDSALNGGTVDDAQVEGGAGKFVRLTISSPRSLGEIEGVTVQGLGSTNCPSINVNCQSPQAHVSFALGILPISYVQAEDPLNTNPCVDRSSYAGAGTGLGVRIATRGVIRFQYGTLVYMADPAGGVRSGVSVFAPPTALTIGHQYLMAVRVQEFSGETELGAEDYIVDEGVGPALPAAVVVPISTLRDSTCDHSPPAFPPGSGSGSKTTGEEYEGMLVKVLNAKVCAFRTPPRDPVAGGEFRITQPYYAGTDSISVFNLDNNYTFDADTTMVVNVTGVLHSAFSVFEICPRNNADIQVVKTLAVDAGPLALALAGSPNPGSSHTISFTVPSKQEVSLSIFDLQGRMVANLVHGPLIAGQYQRKWNGVDSRGNTVGPGMYFYRLQVGNQVREARAVRLD